MALRDLIVQPSTPGAMVTEVERLEQEATALRLGIDKAEDRLAKAMNRAEALSTFVDKQAQHLRELIRRSDEGQIIFLPDYSEMKQKHYAHRQQITQVRQSIAAIKVELKAKKAHLALVDEKLKATRAAIDSRGKLLPLRRP